MPRKPRFIIPGYPQHVVQRGNNRQPVFHCEQDYRFFLKLLRQGCKDYGCSIHAYVLMTNHFHLLITPHMHNSIPELMQAIGRRYVHYFNIRYERTGGLWEGRYKASLIASDRYLLTCYRYVELNPVRAGMTPNLGDYHWSSYSANALGRPDTLLVLHPTYLGLGADVESRQRAYRALFKDCLSEFDLALIRNSLRGCWAIGDKESAPNVKSTSTISLSPKARGGDRRSRQFRSQKINGV